MSATDELRRLLDERGVEWQDEGYPTTNTVWVADGIVWRGLFRDGCIELVAQLTPEQAVEATLGRGTCHSDNNPPLLYDDPFRVFRCSECHHKVDLRRNPKPNYCPNCGRKVVDA